MSFVDKYIHMFYTSAMKIGQYARQQAISYRTTLGWWQRGQIKGYQASTGTIIVAEDEPVQKLAIGTPDVKRPHPWSASGSSGSVMGRHADATR